MKSNQIPGRKLTKKRIIEMSYQEFEANVAHGELANIFEPNPEATDGSIPFRGTLMLHDGVWKVHVVGETPDVHNINR